MFITNKFMGLTQGRVFVMLTGKGRVNDKTLI